MIRIIHNPLPLSGEQVRRFVNGMDLILAKSPSYLSGMKKIKEGWKWFYGTIAATIVSRACDDNLPNMEIKREQLITAWNTVTPYAMGTFWAALSALVAYVSYRIYQWITRYGLLLGLAFLCLLWSRYLLSGNASQKEKDQALAFMMLAGIAVLVCFLVNNRKFIQPVAVIDVTVEVEE